MEESYSDGRRDPDEIPKIIEDTQNQCNLSEEINGLMSGLIEELIIKCTQKGKDLYSDDVYRELIEEESESIVEEFQRRIMKRLFSGTSETDYERSSIEDIRRMANEEIEKIIKDFEEKCKTRTLNTGSEDSIRLSLKGDPSHGRRTLALIKPDAYKHANEIIYIMKKHGFLIVQLADTYLDLQEIILKAGLTDLESRLELRLGQSVSPALRTISWRSKYVLGNCPIVALCIASSHCPNTVVSWREIMGPSDVAEAAALFPNSLRAKYGNAGDQVKNALHGSHSIEDAEREIHFFFPEIILDPLPKITDIGSILDKESQKVFKKGLVMLCKEKPENPVKWFACWLLHNNPKRPSCSLDEKPTIHFDDELGTGKKCFINHKFK